MFDFVKAMTPAPRIRPSLNCGCLMDIPTGRYYTGKHGESLLSGGLSHSEGTCAGPNHFKTTLMVARQMIAMDRYHSAGQFYCTELTGQQQRISDIAQRVAVDTLKGEDVLENGRYLYTDKTVYNGTKWYDTMLEQTKHRIARPKSELAETPFLNRDGSYINILAPYIVAMDSLSMFSTENVLKIQEKGSIGDGDRNTEALRDAGAKTQLLMEMPTFTAERGIYLMMTAHMGDVHQLDPRSPPRKKLAFMQAKIKIKNVPEKFTFLPNNVWYIMGASPMFQDDKTVEFPRSPDDDLQGDTDLMLTTVCNLRGKGGNSGLPFELIFSQSEGLKVGLSEYYYLKNNEKYGIGGNNTHFFMDLLPDVNLRRTTIRSKIEENVKLQRVLQITSEMCQIANLWHHIPKEVLCTPKQLFDDLKAMGYDWDQLLATRGYWTFNNDTHPVPYLSTMDLLNMRMKTYRPYWMK